MELKRRWPHNVNGISLDPQPDWSFNELLSELKSIDNRTSSSEFSGHFTKKQPKQLKTTKRKGNDAGGFSVGISNDNSYDTDSVCEVAISSAQGRRFVCGELDESDDSDNEVASEIQCWTGKASLAKSTLHQLAKDYFMSAMEKTRSKIQLMEEKLADEYEITMSSLNEIDRHREKQHRLEIKLDMDYKQTIAEALDSYLTPVQRDRENISQSEERKIRDDAAREEAKRKEKALERQKAEEESRLKAELAEKARAAEMEAEKRAAEEAAARLASEKLKETTSAASGDPNAVSHAQAAKKK